MSSNDSGASSTTVVSREEVKTICDEEKTTAEPAIGDDSEGKRAVEVTGFRWLMLSGAVFFATTLLALDNTIVADLQPQIIEALGEISKFPWINVTFSLGYVASTLLWGKLYGLFDNKALFITCVALFEIGAAVSGAAPNMNALIVGRAIGGVGGNGLYLGAMNVITVFTTVEQRPLYFSIFGISWGIGTVLGPICGGLLSQASTGWRWSFYLNLVAGAIIVPIYLWLLPRHHPTSGISKSKRLQQLDGVGFLLWAGGLVSGVMAVSFGGAVFTWRSGSTIGLLCCSALCWILFIAQQITATFTTTSRRLLPVNALRILIMWILVIQTCATTGILFVTLNYLPLYLQFARGETALQAGIDMLPLIFTAVVTMLLNGILMPRTRYYAPWYVVGAALQLVGTVLMYTVKLESSKAQIYGYTVLIACCGFYIMANYPIAQLKTPRTGTTKIQDAVTIIGCSQAFATAASLAVANSIFVNRAAKGMAKILPDLPRSDVQAAIAGVGAPIFDSLPADLKQRTLEVVVSAIRDVWAQAIAVAAASFLLVIFMKWERMPTEMEEPT